MSGIFKEGYFTEECPLWPGRAFSVRILEALESKTTDFQLAEIFRGEGFGLMLALDGKIQLAESDEFIYHEMFAHVPAFCHENPEKILVIGGGDGALVREILRHPCVENIVLCEIDEEVVKLCSRYFPWTENALNSNKVEVHYRDGAEFVRSHPGCYDLIYVDGPDPIGPGETLFTEDFLSDCKKALRPGGILAAQSEAYLMHPDVTKRQYFRFRELFQNASYYSFMVPSYPGGSLGICVGCDDHALNVPVRRPLPYFQRKLRFYSGETHRAAFVLPPFWLREIRSDED